MTAIIDYGVGNIFSLESSFAAIGQKVIVTSDPEELRRAKRLVLPGVGAFEDAAKMLRDSGLWDTVISLSCEGVPLLGICLGMQLLFEKSYEFGEHEGLGLIPGEIVPLRGFVSEEVKIPQIGWNALNFTNDSPLFKYISDGDFVYFVHSYYAKCDETQISATTQYGGTITACVQRGNVFGCQFHPEKSGSVGLGILRAFCEK